MTARRLRQLHCWKYRGPVGLPSYLLRSGFFPCRILYRAPCPPRLLLYWLPTERRGQTESLRAKSSRQNIQPLSATAFAPPADFGEKWLLVEIAGLVGPEPQVSDLLVVELRIADVAITRDQSHMRAARGGGVLRAHKHFALVLQATSFHPMALVIFAGDEKHADRLQPIRIRFL